MYENNFSEIPPRDHRVAETRKKRLQQKHGYHYMKIESTKSVLFTCYISSIDACLPLKYSMCYALHSFQGRSDLYRSLFVSVRPHFVILARRATVSVDGTLLLANMI